MYIWPSLGVHPPSSLRNDPATKLGWNIYHKDFEMILWDLVTLERYPFKYFIKSD